MSDKRDDLYILPWVVILILFGLIVRIVYLEAPLQSDDTTYFRIAATYSSETLLNATNQIAFRLGVILPLIVWQKILGENINAYYFFSITYYFLLLISIYFTAFLVRGHLSAIASVVTAATSAFVLSQTSNVLPDVPNLVFMLIAFSLFISTGENHSKKSIFLLIIISSMFAFFSYLSRAPNIVFLVCIPIYEILKDRKIKKSILLGIFFTGFLILEMFCYWMISGNALLRFSVTRQAVDSWAKYEPIISLGQYFLDPLSNYLRLSTGWVLILGGFLGLAFSLIKRNWALVALISGAIFFFIIYSYSVTSFSPLKRALPLQQRYILCFSVILAIGAGFLISVTIEYLRDLAFKGIFKSKFILDQKIIQIVLGVIFLGGISYVQMIELPRSIKGSILLGSDSYFVADRLLRDKMAKTPVSGIVYAHPIKDFILYPNFGRLQLKSLDVSKPAKFGTTILFSKRAILSDRKYNHKYAEILGEKEYIKSLNTYLQQSQLNWDIILDAGDIVMAKILPIKENFIFDFAEPHFNNIWASTASDNGDIINAQQPLTFNLNPQSSPYYVYTFSGGFNSAPRGWENVFHEFNPCDIVKFELSYELDEDIKSLAVFLSEYSDEMRGQSISQNLNATAGRHTYSDVLRLGSKNPSFRVFLRIENKNKSKLIINFLKVSVILYK